jgi:AcrR family transcriptional regulator
MSASTHAQHGQRRLDLRAASEALAEGWEPSITMAEVAGRLGVAKPTLYRLAGSKAALVRACVDAEMERLLDHMHGALTASAGASALELAAEALRAVDRYAADSPGGFRLLFERRGPDAQAAIARLETRLTELLRRSAQQAGRSPVRPDLLAAGLLGATAAIVSRGLADAGPVEASVVAADLMAALEG